MSEFLNTPIEFLKGVGPQRAELLRKEIGVFTYSDLLEYFPFRYVDRSYFNKVADLPYLDSFAQVRGVLTKVEESGSPRNKRLVAKFQDTSGTIDLVWYQGIKWIKPTLKLNIPYVIYGKAKIYGSSFQIAHPEIQELDKADPMKGLKAVYRSTEKLSSKGLHSKGIEKLTSTLVQQINGHIPEIFPRQLISDLRLPERESAVKQVHYPMTEDLAKKASFRLKFEELFFLQLELLLRRQISLQKNKGFVFDEVGGPFLEFYEKHLPFELTNAQKRVIKEIRQDCKNGFHMNRLVQGDVGSGKTMVAFLCMLIAIGNGFQAAMMAPTEILAQQHFESISELCKNLPVRVEKLSGSTKKSSRKHLHEALENGEIHILIGTHALIEDTVQFKNLGLVVIDEQHRFGVAQRSRLWQKNERPPHILVMTATPIPRTLAMTVYGDLDVSVIDELPPGRKPITTQHRFEASRLAVFEFMRKEIALGRQIYVVFPLIAESETLDYHNLMAGFESISRAFPLPQYQVSIVHGQLKPEVKDYEMQRFVKGETQIMVATTVIEVGVNVPNASVMVIESAERFGLSQLHQLRGRVGRGAEKSYCILMTGQKLSKESKTRLETMVRTQDGFEIAEVDLELRGPGDLMGTQQSGILDLKIADLTKDGQIVALAREKAREILAKDSNLSLPEHAQIRQRVVKILNEKPNWGRIS
ncbi:MAG: recG [Crocinitomicaceae bacterium]|jgi:ATP-dependent DNA helicase RecG|nr:recG [Crocinitomicaceae bacterium]